MSSTNVSIEELKAMAISFDITIFDEESIEEGKKMNATKENKLPFDITIFDKEDKTVTNRLTKKSAILTPIQLAVYDCIKGSELILRRKELHENETSIIEIDHDKLKEIIKKGIDWFRSNYSEIYYILLD